MPPQIPSQLLTLDAAQLQQVDTATLEQKRTERIERLVWGGGQLGGADGDPIKLLLVSPNAHPPLPPPPKKGFDPDAPAKFRPRHKAKGSGALHRKRKVAHQQQRVRGPIAAP